MESTEIISIPLPSVKINLLYVYIALKVISSVWISYSEIERNTLWNRFSVVTDFIKYATKLVFYNLLRHPEWALAKIIPLVATSKVSALKSYQKKFYICREFPNCLHCNDSGQISQYQNKIHANKNEFVMSAVGDKDQIKRDKKYFISCPHCKKCQKSVSDTAYADDHNKSMSSYEEGMLGHYIKANAWRGTSFGYQKSKNYSYPYNLTGTHNKAPQNNSFDNEKIKKIVDKYSEKDNKTTQPKKFNIGAYSPKCLKCNYYMSYDQETALWKCTSKHKCDIWSSKVKPDSCPKCGKYMVHKKAKHGPFAGKYFWGCGHFPKCRQIVNQLD